MVSRSRVLNIAIDRVIERDIRSHARRDRRRGGGCQPIRCRCMCAADVYVRFCACKSVPASLRASGLIPRNSLGRCMCTVKTRVPLSWDSRTFLALSCLPPRVLLVAAPVLSLLGSAFAIIPSPTMPLQFYNPDGRRRRKHEPSSFAAFAFYRAPFPPRVPSSSERGKK